MFDSACLAASSAQHIDICPAFNDPIVPEDSASNVGDNVASEVDEGLSHVTSSGATSSPTSLLSVGGGEGRAEGGRCFRADALFKVSEGVYAAAERLEKGMCVRGASGHSLTVESHEVFPEQNQQLIEFRTKSQAGLTVTTSHRVMVERGHNAQTIPASSLKVGDKVYCSGDRLEELVYLQTRPPPSPNTFQRFSTLFQCRRGEVRDGEEKGGRGCIGDVCVVGAGDTPEKQKSHHAFAIHSYRMGSVGAEKLGELISHIDIHLETLADYLMH